MLPSNSYPYSQVRVHIKDSAFFGRSELRYLLSTLLPILKADSEATDVIGIAMISRAIMVSTG